ncbi:hypothetical protein GCM10010329_19540 [Streptomyces spiroverticillatus]|nr:hypothetical protein GCM10010329_19540 [Streptomyces spiroverticillatus]
MLSPEYSRSRTRTSLPVVIPVSPVHSSFAEVAPAATVAVVRSPSSKVPLALKSAQPARVAAAPVSFVVFTSTAYFVAPDSSAGRRPPSTPSSLGPPVVSRSCGSPPPSRDLTGPREENTLAPSFSFSSA